MSKLKATLLYLAITSIGFYLLPLSLGLGSGFVMITMFIAVPLVCFFAPIFYGIKHGFNILLALGTTVFLVLAELMFIGEIIWGLTIAIFVFSVAGNFIGKVIYDRE